MKRIVTSQRSKKRQGVLTESDTEAGGIDKGSQDRETAKES